MKKEEILEKSRQLRKDEGMEYAENQGRKIGFVAFVFIFMFLAIFTLFYGESITLHAITSLFWAYLAAEAYGKYAFTRKKEYLITMVAGSVASILSIANYIITTLR